MLAAALAILLYAVLMLTFMYLALVGLDNKLKAQTLSASSGSKS